MNGVRLVMKCLAFFINASGMSYSMFSDTSELPKSTVSDIVSGRSEDIKFSTLEKLCVALNLDLADLLIGLGMYLRETYKH